MNRLILSNVLALCAAASPAAQATSRPAKLDDERAKTAARAAPQVETATFALG